MKVCKDCNVELVVGTNWTESRKKVSAFVCKSCANKRSTKWQKNNRDKAKVISKRWSDNNPDYRPNQNKKYYKERFLSKKDGLWYVYIANQYAGITENPYRRNIEHERYTGHGSIRVIHTTDSEQDARELEGLLHDIGYLGRHAVNG